MKASELIKKVEEYKEQYGDLPVIINEEYGKYSYVDNVNIASLIEDGEVPSLKNEVKFISLWKQKLL